jgi:hypothetical protein
MTKEPVAAVLDEDSRSAFVVVSLDLAGSIEGRITRPEGQPWIGIPVGGYPTNGPKGGGWLLDSGFSSFSQLELTHTNEEGRFRLEGLLDGYEYELACIPDPERPRNWVREGPVLPGSSELHIVIDEARIRGGVLTGDAYNEVEGEAVEQMYFFMYDRAPGRPWRSVSKKVALEDGAFLIEGLVVGNEYFVEALVGGAGRLTIGPWIASLTPHRADLDFGLDGSARISARYSNGQPGLDWTLSVVETGEGPRSPFRRRPEGQAGVAVFEPLAAGKYRVTAERDGATLDAIEFVVMHDRITELDLDLGTR